jgi:hypothetical protein
MQFLGAPTDYSTISAERSDTQADMDRGGLTVCGALGQSSVRGPRALKNVVGCECVLDALLFV